MYSKIVVALQEQEADETLVSHVCSLARLHSAKVTLLRVIAVSDDGGDGLGHQFQMELGSSGWRRKKRARAYLDQLERRLRLQGCLVETALVTGGRSEADAIVRFADEIGCNLLAMAADARPWYLRLIEGNTSTVVQRKATVPSLFVRDGLRKAAASKAVPSPHPVLAAFGAAEL